jgi:hypothetical protein
MPETEELNGMGYSNFRTGRKSFATIEDTKVLIRLTRDQQAIFVATAPEVFAPDASGWGRLGNTVMRLEVADEATVKVAIATAWRNVAEVGNAFEVADVVEVENADGVANVAQVVATDSAPEVAGDCTADARINAPLLDVAAEVPGEVNVPEVVEVSAGDVPKGAAVVEPEKAAVTVEDREHLLRLSQATTAGGHEKRSMPFRLLAVVKRESMIDLKYGQAFNDPQPFVLTVTPQYVAHETTKFLPISASDVHAYILAHAAKLKVLAERLKAQDLASEVLQ